MRTEKELRELYELAMELITTSPKGEPPPEAHVMLWMAIGYSLGKPEHAHVANDARKILEDRRREQN